MNWMLDLAIVLTCGLWCLAGIEICRFTHRQRGIEVDNIWEWDDPLPQLPGDFVLWELDFPDRPDRDERIDA